MDFVRLGPAYSTSYIPDALIEGYNSLIWTERFEEPGEFELKSFDVAGLLAALPENTLVSHLETREVMIVETHSIEMVGEGADAQPEITITGRSAYTILEHRWVESTYQTKRSLRRTYSATSALCVLLYNAVDNTSGRDVTRGDTLASTVELNDYPWSTLDAIPNIAVTESVPAEGPLATWYVEEGILWPQFQKIMVDSDLGLRLIRPVDAATPGTVITVNSAIASRGQVNRIFTADIRQLQFNIYAGVDRSAGANAVQLSQLQGHLENPKYLFSNKDFKTGLEIMSGAVDVSDVYRDATEAAFSGWKRRIMGFDGGTPEIPAAPEQPQKPKRNATTAAKNAYEDAYDAWVDKYAIWLNKRATIITSFRAAQSKLALVELKLARRVNMFAGDMSDVAPYKYKVHYDLGDLVMLYGDYGQSVKMLVNEYVRTEDENGDRGFPGLVVP